MAGVPPATSGSGAYGTIPQVPDPTQTSLAAILGNIGNLGNIYQLGQGLNTLSAQNAAAQYQANLPGYQNLIGQASQNVQGNLQGQLPPDVINLIKQQAAERGVATGMPDSPNANAAYLRALGLTSLDLENLGQQQFGNLMRITPTGPQFNPASMLVTPGEEQSAAAAQALYNAAPNPTQAAAQARQDALDAISKGGLAIPGVGGGFGSITPPGGASAPTRPYVEPPEIVGGAKGTPSASPAQVQSNYENWVKNLPVGKPTGDRATWNTIIHNADGTVTTIHPDGTQETSEDYKSWADLESAYWGDVSGTSTGTNQADGGKAVTGTDWTSLSYKQYEQELKANVDPESQLAQMVFQMGFDPSQMTNEEAFYLTGYQPESGAGNVSTPADTFGMDQGYGDLYGSTTTQPDSDLYNALLDQGVDPTGLTPQEAQQILDEQPVSSSEYDYYGYD